MWKHLPDANENIRDLMIEYVKSSNIHESGGICRFMQNDFSDYDLDSYAIIDSFGVNGYLGASPHGVNATRLNFANRVIDNITHPGIKILGFESTRILGYEEEGPYKIVASSTIPGAKQARERIVRYARKNSSW